ncbi:MAG TPA: hypothetical protein PLE16_14665 [Spirochaetota bacterium]|nr:hypothetical protein [Spirochaetota bacterium]HPY02028.1 hypothetical protein [Spirochaetota bacterium]HQA51777.1 hypothetical protein [Spirochaetota bacterium]
MRSLILVLTALVLCSCNSADDVYKKAVKAYAEKDAAAFEKCLSSSSLSKTVSAIELIKQLSPEAKKELQAGSKHKMKDSSVKEYLLFQMNVTAGDNSFEDRFGSKIKTVSVNGDEAEVLNENGVIVKLVKENGEWKIDL